MPITFDTLAYSNELKRSGIPSAQAEAQAEALFTVFSGLIENDLATKEDLKGTELKLTLRVGAMLAGGIGLLTTLLVILHLH